MKPLRSSLVLLLTALLVPSCRAAEPTPNAQTLVNGNNEFAIDLYGRLKSTPGNLFFSPYSISTCLAMTYAGARGQTPAQMSRVLHFPGTQAEVNAGFAKLQDQLKTDEHQQGVELNLANALWAQQGHPFLPAFLQTARREYSAEVRQADFQTDAAAATREINDWVARQTQNKIQDILPPGTLNQATRMVLANAIYFKGTWASPFEKSKTRPMPFHSSSSRQTNVPFMSQAETLNYGENNSAQIVELSYRGGSLTMVILLPRQVDGCAQLENSLNPTALQSWLGSLHRQNVELFVPKFKLEAGFSLQPTLMAMGMTVPFGSEADFSGMDGVRDLFISSVRHKAWVDVDEEGTEAAAATTVTIRATAVMRPPASRPVFRADHPFIFLIRDARSGTVLFLGRLAEPGQ